MKRIVIDPHSGMAGDMFSAALIHGGADEKKVVEHMTAAAASLGGATISAGGKERGRTTGILLDIKLIHPPHSKEAEYLRESLIAYMEKSGLKEPYKGFALKALDILITAEKKAHEKMDGHHHHHHHHHCHLHEAQDIIIDITGAAWGMQELDIDMEQTVCLTPVTVGFGKISFSHGKLDVPAPATASILEDYHIPVQAGDMEAELLTPTGAAILAALAPRFQERAAYNAKDTNWSTGFGTKEFSPEKPNGLNISIE